MIFDERGKLLTGGDVPSVVAMLEGLRVDALGINCGMGPEQMLSILEELFDLHVTACDCKAKCRTSETEGRADLLRCSAGRICVYDEIDCREGRLYYRGVLRNNTGTYPTDDNTMSGDESSSAGKEASYTRIFLWKLHKFWQKACHHWRTHQPTGKKEIKQALKERRF